MALNESHSQSLFSTFWCKMVNTKHSRYQLRCFIDCGTPSRVYFVNFKWLKVAGEAGDKIHIVEFRNKIVKKNCKFICFYTFIGPIWNCKHRLKDKLSSFSGLVFIWWFLCNVHRSFHVYVEQLARPLNHAAFGTTIQSQQRIYEWKPIATVADSKWHAMSNVRYLL